MSFQQDPKYSYTELCNIMTVQNQSAGFFQDLFDKVLDLSSEKWMKTRFVEQPTDFDKVRCLYQDKDKEAPGSVLIEMLKNNPEIYKLKNANFSGQRRREGERLIDSKTDHKKALAMLNRAVLGAPKQGL